MQLTIACGLGPFENLTPQCFVFDRLFYKSLPCTKNNCKYVNCIIPTGINLGDMYVFGNSFTKQGEQITMVHVLIVTMKG